MSPTENIVPLLTLCLPLVTAFLLWRAGTGINRIAGWLGAGVTFSGLLFLAFFFLQSNGIPTLTIDWASIGDFTLKLTFKIDNQAWLLLLIVHFIATLVQLYSTAYLHDDPGRYRYFASLQLFLFSMNGIIMGGSLIVMYIFWEMVGLCSYLLIGFWHHKPRAAWAAQKAMIMNRIGDAAFLTGILLLFYHVGHTEFSDLPDAIGNISTGMLTFIGICLFGGCAGKSAQFPLSAWLPDAMEGPTPVSALIHAATMVAAGIFLMARIAFLLTPTAQAVVIAIGAITMLHGAIRALTSWDIKGVLAFSTMSQLGLMVIAVGMGSWQAALFHLTTHAFFKAGLFLSAGSVIHAMTPHTSHESFDPQDMRNMGNLRKQMPITFICYLILSAALAGVPFLSGFLSKDAIFIEAFSWAERLGGIAWAVPLIAVVAAGLTAFYMFRQVVLVFFGHERYNTQIVHPHESPTVMWIPMVLLTGLSFFFVFSMNPLDASNGWFYQLFPTGDAHHSLTVPIISVIVTASAVFLGWRFSRTAGGFTQPVTTLRIPYPLLEDFNVTNYTTTFFLKPFQQCSRVLGKVETYIIDAIINGLAKISVIIGHLVSWFDRLIVDGAVKSIVYTIESFGQAVRSLQTGKIQSYYLVTVVSIFVLLLWWISQ